MNKELNIVLPVFNAEKTISVALESLQNQSFSSWECIVVDDGSTDKTQPIISNFKNRDSRFKIIKISHSGIVTALNVGLENANAPFIARMDADDISLPERFFKQIDFLQKNPKIDAVSCLVEHVANDEKSTKGFARYVEWTNQIITPEDHFLNRFIESPVIHPTVMFRKEVLENFKGYSEAHNWPEDYELWLRWMEKGVTFAKVPEKLFCWTDREDRLSRTHSSCITEAFYECKTEYLISGPLKNCSQVGIFGAGRVSRKRSELLSNYGKEIIFYIDIDPQKIGKKINNRPVISPDKLEELSKIPLISYIGTHGARDAIRKILKGSKYIEGENFWCMA